jgi:hypothetical protein
MNQRIAVWLSGHRCARNVHAGIPNFEYEKARASRTRNGGILRLACVPICSLVLEAVPIFASSSSHCTVKATEPTVALTEPDVPVTVIV